jgi:hypothetical protein
MKQKQRVNSGNKNIFSPVQTIESQIKRHTEKQRHDELKSKRFLGMGGKNFYFDLRSFYMT